MISSKVDLSEYLAQDKKALGRSGCRPAFNDEIWRFQIALRKCEYYQNCKKGGIGKLVGIIWRIKKHRLAIRCGYSIPNNVVGPGLCLAHIGTVVISPYARLGKNCRIHVGVNIGADARNQELAPQIGDNVYIAPGAKLFGGIFIADGVAIGANAVVTKSFYEQGVSIAGVPARIINRKGVQGIL